MSLKIITDSYILSPPLPKRGHREKKKTNYAKLFAMLKNYD